MFACQPTQTSSQPIPTAAGDVSWLAGSLRPQAKLIGFGLVTAILAGIIATIDPLLMKHLLDTTLPQRKLASSLMIVMLLAFCFVARAALNGGGGLLSYRASQLFAQELRTRTLEHMTRLSADWHEQTLVGEKLSRVDLDVLQIAQVGAEMTNTVVRSVVFFFVNLAIMFSLNAKMTLVTLPLLPLFIWVRARFRGTIQSRADQAQTEVGVVTGALVEHLGAVPQIQLLGAEEDQLERTVRAWLRVVAAQWIQRRTEILFSLSVTSVLAMAILLVLGFGIHEYSLGLLTLGGLVAFYTYVTRIFEPVSTALELYSRTQRLLASVRRVRAILLTEPTVKDRGSISVVQLPLSKGIICDSVSFAYRPSHNVLHQVSFEIGASEKVAIVGKSGSGKSTLSRLLARIADPTAGVILVGGRPLTDYALRTLRCTVCYVPQHPILFSGTIRENLRMADPSATTVMLEEVIEIAQLRPLLTRLPHGLDTALGQEAAGLSGGERQRLAIARALLQRAPILILDESTSALDLPTEQKLLRALAESCKSTSLVLISHRLMSLAWVDRVIVLDAGHVVAMGSHEVLYGRSKTYQSLYDNDAEPGITVSLQNHVIPASYPQVRD